MLAKFDAYVFFGEINVVCVCDHVCHVCRISPPRLEQGRCKVFKSTGANTYRHSHHKYYFECNRCKILLLMSLRLIILCNRRPENFANNLIKSCLIFKISLFGSICQNRWVQLHPSLRRPCSTIMIVRDK